MFFKNKVKKNIEIKETTILQECLDNYYYLMLHCHELIEASKKKNLNSIFQHIDSLVMYQDRLEFKAISNLEELERILTGEGIYLDRKDFYDFLIGKVDKLKFYIRHWDEITGYQNECKSYEKSFKLHRRKVDFNKSEVEGLNISKEIDELSKPPRVWTSDSSSKDIVVTLENKEN